MKKDSAVATVKNMTVKRDNEKTPDSVEEAAVALQYEQYSGPIPPATEVEMYERVYPGAARELFDMARNIQKMRSDRQVALHNENMKCFEVTSSGQLYSFLIFIGFIVGACVLGYFKMEKAACGAFGAAIAFAAGIGVRAFVPRNSSERRD